MNVEKVVEALEAWIALAENARFIGGWSGNEPQIWVRKDDPAASRLRENHDQVSQIVGHIFGTSPAPELIYTSADGDLVVQYGIELAGRALGRVRTLDETRAMLGSDAPTMHADALHPLIWDAASKRWGSGHYSDAVQRAATFLNAHVQDLTGRTDVSDNDLMSQAFSLSDPQPGKPRLRWPGEDSNLTVKAMRVGILNLSQGVFSAIRNPATHSTEDMERQEALEQLATLSILARWIERCDLIFA